MKTKVLASIVAIGLTLALSACSTAPAPVATKPASSIDPKGKMTNEERYAAWKKTHADEPTEEEVSKRQFAEERAAAQRRRDAYADVRTDLPEEHRAAIRRGSVLTGMTIAEVEASWGSEHGQRTSGGVGGDVVTLIYPHPYTDATDMLFFVDGKLARWNVDR